ncbi:hypothetical protein [Streptomyces hirsutus]
MKPNRARVSATRPVLVAAGTLADAWLPAGPYGVLKALGEVRAGAGQPT